MYMYIALEVVTGDNLEKGYAAALELAHDYSDYSSMIWAFYWHKQ